MTDIMENERYMSPLEFFLWHYHHKDYILSNHNQGFSAVGTSISDFRKYHPKYRTRFANQIYTFVQN
jgi:hypothetical protein